MIERGDWVLVRGFKPPCCVLAHRVPIVDAIEATEDRMCPERTVRINHQRDEYTALYSYRDRTMIVVPSMQVQQPHKNAWFLQK